MSAVPLFHAPDTRDRPPSDAARGLEVWWRKQGTKLVGEWLGCYECPNAKEKAVQPPRHLREQWLLERELSLLRYFTVRLSTILWLMFPLEPVTET
jgi:hypothetical protein